MVNLKALNERIVDSGITMTALAEKCGFSRETLYNKISGASEFKASEMHSMTRALRLTKEERDAIFFAD